MEKRQLLYKWFNDAFSAFMVLMVAISVFSHDNPFLQLGKVQLLVVAVGVCAVLFGTLLLWDKYAKQPSCKNRTLALLFGIYFLLQLAVAIKLQVLPKQTWDYPIVYNEAANRVLNGALPTDYFAQFPNNTPYYWVLCGFFGVLHWFGVQNFMLPLLVLNSLCIDIALWMIYKTACCILGNKWGFAALLLGFISPALLLYVPIAYTDTLSLPFVCGAVYSWVLARKKNQTGEKQGAIQFTVLAAVLVAAGTILKISVAILMIAFVIDILLFWEKKNAGSCMLSAVISFALLFSAGNGAAQKAMPAYNTVGIPHTHWIMMGLNGNGNYCDADYQLTLSHDTYKERVAFTEQEIVNRIQAMGPIGFVSHCKEKLAFMISDGTYFAPAKLDRNAKQPSVWHAFVVPNGKYAGFLYYWADGLQICLLLACAAGSWYAAKNRDNSLTVCRVAWFGLVLFLLLWENRSRYLLNFLPLFLLCAVDGFYALVKNLNSK